MNHTCEEQEFEDPVSSEETMSYAEQIATVEEVRYNESKTEFHRIKVKWWRPSNAERHWFSRDPYLITTLAENGLSNLEH